MKQTTAIVFFAVVAYGLFLVNVRRKRVKENQASQDVAAPIGLAITATLLAFAVAYFLTGPMFFRLEASWIRCLICLLASIGVSSVVLYRSAWRRDLQNPARLCLILMAASAIAVIASLFVAFTFFIVHLLTSGPPAGRKG